MGHIGQLMMVLLFELSSFIPEFKLSLFFPIELNIEFKLNLLF